MNTVKKKLPMKAMAREILLLNSETLQGIYCIRDALSTGMGKRFTGIVHRDQ